jgi:hypothetical protein
MQPEHASATAITRTNDLIRFPPMRKYRPQILTVYESGRGRMARLKTIAKAISKATLGTLDFAAKPPYPDERDTPPHRGASIWKGRRR